jgi:hypothetical protein
MKSIYNSVFRKNDLGKYKYDLTRFDVPVGSNIFVDEVAPLGLINARDDSGKLLKKIYKSVSNLSEELKEENFRSFSKKMRDQVEDDYDAYGNIQLLIKALKEDIVTASQTNIKKLLKESKHMKEQLKINTSKYINEYKSIERQIRLFQEKETNIKKVKTLSKISNKSNFHRLVEYGNGNRPEMPIKNYTFNIHDEQQFRLIKIIDGDVTEHDMTSDLKDFAMNSPYNFYEPTSTVLIYTFNIIEYIRQMTGDNMFELLMIDLSCSSGEINGYITQKPDFFVSRSKSIETWRNVHSKSSSKNSDKNSNNSTRKKKDSKS